MKPSSFLYAVRQGFKNIGRNKMFSIASVATMTACIFLFGVLFSVIMNVDSVRRDIEEKVGVTVFFVEGTSEERIAEIGEEIRKIDHVTEVTYTSADEAWENYKAEHFASNPSLAEGFKENPLTNSSSYTVLVDKIERQKAVVDAIGKIDGVRQINQSSAAVQNLAGFNRIFTGVSIAIIVVLLVVSAILIANAVSMGVEARSKEISIMKLIGATDTFVRAPFVVEGLILGLIGTVLPLTLLYIVYNGLIRGLLQRLGFMGRIGDVLTGAGHVFAVLAPIGLILGLGIGLIGARITLKRHLDV